MSIDLCREQGHMGFNIWNWSKILTLAQQYGWQPMGTKTPESIPELGIEWKEGEWEKDPNYVTNDRQGVTSEDAANIAAALERALADIPDHDAYQDKRVVNQGPTDTASPFERFSDKICTALIRGLPAMEIRIFRDDRAVGWNTVMAHNTLEWFSGQGKEKVQEFIAFCKTGGFTIW